jgi:hypothetical protein
MSRAPILQAELPVKPWLDLRTRRLPGIQPVEAGDWLRVDDAYAGQMALRDRLIADQPDAVHALLPEAREAAAELLARVLAELRGMAGFVVGAEAVTRPDAVRVPIDRTEPLVTLGRLVQEDLCLLQPQGDQHVLTGAILCFPASWTLDEKIGRPLIGIHDTVPDYNADVAARVQRLFDAIRVEQPLWRANVLRYADPDLHQPRRVGAPRAKPATAPFIRSERQCLVRLATSRAVVFSIHTYVVRDSCLTPDESARLDAHLGA